MVKKRGKTEIDYRLQGNKSLPATKPFKLENWQEIFPFLRKGMWAAKKDLKHAYFHLGIVDSLKEYICIQLEEKSSNFRGLLGMSTLPRQWQSVMKVFPKKW